MAIKTTLAQLEEVQAAITAVCLNQSYTLDGRSVSRANLDALTSREKTLLDRYYSETGDKPVVQNFDLASAGGYGT